MTQEDNKNCQCKHQECECGHDQCHRHECDECSEVDCQCTHDACGCHQESAHSCGCDHDCDHCDSDCYNECDHECGECDHNCGGCDHDCENCGSSNENQGCDHDCAHCDKNCSSRIEKFELNPLSSVRHTIGIVSGKGGVGKSFVTSLLASSVSKKGYNVGVLDADITGPSMAKVFGIDDHALGSDQGIYPATSALGVQVISTNMLLEDEETPVIWRGPVLAGLVKQFYSDVIWEDVDFMFVDMPPGTGDVPLTVFQSVPLDGIVVVTTPQDLVNMVVMKAVNMANQMNIPILGVVENMAYFSCEECGCRNYPFGKGDVQGLAANLGIPYALELPINPDYAKLSDLGRVEFVDNEDMNDFASALIDHLDDIQ